VKRVRFALSLGAGGLPGEDVANLLESSDLGIYLLQYF
jgi:hypothetical protein